MRTRYLTIAAAAAMTLAAGAATAVGISNLSGQSCGADSGAWHFVNNQITSPAASIGFSATWSSGDTCTLTTPSKITGGTVHFNCSASGTLLTASTTNGGRLVLSDFACSKKTCDPKTEKCD